MTARASSHSLLFPDICYMPFGIFLTSRPRIAGPLVSACVLRVIHPVQEQKYV